MSFTFGSKETIGNAPDSLLEQRHDVMNAAVDAILGATLRYEEFLPPRLESPHQQQVDMAAGHLATNFDPAQAAPAQDNPQDQFGLAA